MKFLICEDGSPTAQEAARYGGELARQAAADIIRLQVHSGDAVAQILNEATRGNFNLIVIGSRGGRGLAKLLMGETASRLAKRSPMPLLIVKGKRESARQILVCTGGETPKLIAAEWGGRVSAWTGASVTVLHVMSQLPIAEASTLADLQVTADAAIAQGTREGKHLQANVDRARECGAHGAITPKLRHGLVLEEIVDEVESGGYDLVVIGAHAVPRGTPLGGLLLDDMAGQIIQHCPRPVLVVR